MVNKEKVASLLATLMIDCRSSRERDEPREATTKVVKRAAMGTKVAPPPAKRVTVVPTRETALAFNAALLVAGKRQAIDPNTGEGRVYANGAPVLVVDGIAKREDERAAMLAFVGDTGEVHGVQLERARSMARTLTGDYSNVSSRMVETLAVRAGEIAPTRAAGYVSGLPDPTRAAALHTAKTVDLAVAQASRLEREGDAAGAEKILREVRKIVRT